MPEAAISSPASVTAPITPATTGGESSPEPKITYGSPEGDTQHTSEVRDGANETTQDDTSADDFGELDSFGDEEEAAITGEPEKFSSEQYKALKQALAANPELFKAVKREISENSRYKQVHETPEAAREAADRIESLGGLESIETESKEWSTVYAMFASGDPGVIDYWAKDNPQALSKLFPHVYDRVAESDPATWAHKAAGTFMATAQQQGMISNLETLSSLGGSPEQKALIQKLIASFNAINDVSQRAPTQDLTPQAKQLADREKGLKDQESQLYQRGVSQQVAPLISKNAAMALNAVIKGRKLSVEAKKDLLRDINFEYANLAKKDSAFQNNAKALLAAGETEKFLKLVTSNLNRTMPLAARRIWRKYTGISGLSASESSARRAEGQSRRESGGGGTTLSVVKTAPPKPQDVDWGRMRQEFGRDTADEVFSFGKKGINGGIRFYYKKGDAKTIFTF